MAVADEPAHIHRTFTFERLDGLRRRCDPLADDVVAAIAADPTLRRERDLLAACEALAARGEPAATRFVAETAVLPAWVDFARFTKGREMFLRYGGLSLLVGFTVLVDSYAGAKDNKVLVASGRLRDAGAFRRLVETASFTLTCVEEDALRPRGPGHRAALSVRLLHAKVRRHCRAVGHDVARYDEPINQEAMCGTLMLFSCGVIIALERLGVHVTDEEKESYHALWRAAGWLLGIDEELLPETWAGELALYDRLKAHQYWPDDDTRLLFEQAVRGVSRGTAALPWWIQLLGGRVMQSETFLRAFTARCVDPRLAAHLDIRVAGAHRAAFSLAAVAFGAASRFEGRRPLLHAAMTRANAALVRRVVAEMIADRPVRFEDPGFARGAAARTSGRRKPAVSSPVDA